MDQGKITKQMIDFHKTTFDNTFNAMSILQEQTERMVNVFLEQSSWVPAEGRKAIEEWLKAYKQGRDNFKTTVDDSYKKVDDFFQDTNKESKTKAPGKTK